MPDRREFLCDAASLIACTAAQGGFLGLPVRLTSALRVVGSEAVYPIPPQDVVSIDRDHEAILVRYQSKLYVFGLSCPHQRTPLLWEDEERRFRCPKHKSTFEPNGTFVSGRATRDMDRYAIRRDGNNVVADLATLYQQDNDPEHWGQAVVQL